MFLFECCFDCMQQKKVKKKEKASFDSFFLLPGCLGKYLI